MFQIKSTTRIIITGLLCFYVMHYHTHAFADDGGSCFIETRINCGTDCDNNQPKCTINNDNDLFNKTFLNVRPQDSNAARRILVGTTRSELFYEGYCTKINLAFEWQQSFNNSKTAKWFSLNCNDCMSIGIPGNGQTFDIDGRQLGLTTPGLVPGSIGSFCLAPKTQDFIIDLDIQINLDNYLCGLWARIDLPLVWAKRTIGLRIDNDESAQGSDFPPGYFTTDCTTTPANSSIASALQEEGCGKFANRSFSKFGVAGIHFDLGYDFIRNECGNIGASLHLVTPTGTKPKSQYLFEPIIGANRCFQVGGNINAEYIAYYCNGDRNVSFMLDATLTHLFKSTQRRLFALKNNGAGSQYLLLKQFNATGTSVLGTQKAANILCGKTRIGADFMFDGAIMVQLNACSFFYNLGYNLWFRSKEKRGRITYLNDLCCSNFGIKGNQPLSQIDTSPCAEFCGEPCIPDITTASESTIGQPAAADESTTFISPSDIDFCIPLNPHALSHKFFGAVGYNKEYCDRYYEILVGGEVEFSKRNSALNRWGVLLKGGVGF